MINTQITNSTNSKKIIYIVIGCIIFISLCIGLGVYVLARSIKTKAYFSINKSENVIFNNSKNGIEYHKRMVDYLSMSDMAKNIFPVDTTLAGREKSMSNLKDIGIYYWDRNLELLQSLDELNMPENLKIRTKLCKEYCQMNKACYELMFKAIDERTKAYDDEINRQLVLINQKVEEIKKS